MKNRQKRKNTLIATGILFLIGIIGFLLVLSSVGTLDNDYITLSARISLNVRVFIVGMALVSLAVGLYRLLFKQKGGKYNA